MAHCALFLIAVVCCVCSLNAQQYAFGTYYKLWNAQSLWNSRPVDPVFGDYVIPTSSYYPEISGGTWSVGVFLAKETDLPVTVYGKEAAGLKNVDGLNSIPRWPKDSLPAKGSDGHCDIVDAATNIVHSFWKLSQNNVTLRWAATQYAWSPLNGTGWANPSHWYQGARAAGVPTSGGLIRKHEVKDGNSIYNHALAMSLTFNALSPNPGYIYPATNADEGYAGSNYGKIPEGALMMLPPSFNTSSFAWSPDLKKVVETLKVYGAYVVDRNTGTPFNIYVETGSPFKMTNKTEWDTPLHNQLQTIRGALRMVESASYYLDGNNRVLTNPRNVNLLSMRGGQTGWERLSGDATIQFDTWSQSLVYSNSTKSTSCQNWSKLGLNRVSWGKPQAGRNYTIAVTATGGASLRVRFEYNQTAAGSVVNVNLGHGQNYTFTWPQNNPYLVLLSSKPAGPAGSVRGMLIDKNEDNLLYGPKTSGRSPVTSATTSRSPPSTTPSSTSGKSL